MCLESGRTPLLTRRGLRPSQAEFHPPYRDAGQAGQFRLIYNDAVVDQLVELDRQRHQIELIAKRDDLGFSLEAAPEDMSISDSGLINWNPSSKSPENANVVVSISAGEQQLFHAFTLTVSGGDPTAPSIPA